MCKKSSAPAVEHIEAPVQRSFYLNDKDEISTETQTFEPGTTLDPNAVTVNKSFSTYFYSNIINKIEYVYITTYQCF